MERLAQRCQRWALHAYQTDTHDLVARSCHVPRHKTSRGKSSHFDFNFFFPSMRRKIYYVTIKPWHHSTSSTAATTNTGNALPSQNCYRQLARHHLWMNIRTCQWHFIVPRRRCRHVFFFFWDLSRFRDSFLSCFLDHPYCSLLGIFCCFFLVLCKNPNGGVQCRRAQRGVLRYLHHHGCVR